MIADGKKLSKINFCSCLSSGVMTPLSSSNTRIILLICFYLKTTDGYK
jgi:hypothetical protein